MPLVPRRIAVGHAGPVSRSRWTNDGRYMMTCGNDKTVRLWNPHKADPKEQTAPIPLGLEPILAIKTYAGPHGHEIVDVAIAADNASFVSCGGDRAAFMWDVSSGNVLRRFEGHAHRINAVCFNVDNSVLATGSYDQSIRLWDVRSRSREPIQIISDFKDSVSSLSISDCEIVSGCVDGVLRIHDLRVGKCHADKLGQPVTSVQLSQDGLCVVASCLHGVVALLEKSSGLLLKSYNGHTHEQYGLESCFVQSNGCILSASEDNTALMWDLLEGKLVQQLRGHLKPVVGVSAHPKQLMVLTSSLDGTSILWESTDTMACS